MRAFLTLILSAVLFSCVSAQTKTEPAPKGKQTMTATFQYAEMGDYFHLVFKDANGKEWDFGQAKNELGLYKFYDFDKGAPIKKMEGRKYKITWEMRKTKYNCCEGAMDLIEGDLPTIIEISGFKN